MWLSFIIASDFPSIERNTEYTTNNSKNEVVELAAKCLAQEKATVEVAAKCLAQEKATKSYIYEENS